MQEHTPKRQSSWFTRQFLNSQMVVSLLILLLVLLIIWVFTRITHVFAPIGVVIDVRLSLSLPQVSSIICFIH